MDKSVGIRFLEILMTDVRELVGNILCLSVMEEIARECDSRCIVMESVDIDSSQGNEVTLLEGAMDSECGNACPPLELVCLTEAEVDVSSEVIMFDVITECPVWLFANICDLVVRLEPGVLMVIPMEVSSDVNSCSFVRDMFTVDMSLIHESTFVGASVWLGSYFVVESVCSSVLDCIQVVFQPCLGL